MIKLNNWYFRDYTDTDVINFKEPGSEHPNIYLFGEVFGTPVQAGIVRSVFKGEKGILVWTIDDQTFNLQEPEVNYAGKFPDIKERLFTSYDPIHPDPPLEKFCKTEETKAPVGTEPICWVVLDPNFKKENPMNESGDTYQEYLDSTVSDMCRRMMDPEVYELGFQNNHYKYIEKHGKVFSDALGIDDVTKSLVADGDKCYQYKDDWEDAGVPFVIGAMIYIASKEAKYINTVRQTDKGFVEPCQWVIDKFHSDPEIIAAVKAVRATYE